MKNNAHANISWKNTGFFKSMASNVPLDSGVYVITDTNRVMGLPTNIDILYVGKAKNLRRRFLDHVDPWREHNKGLLTINKTSSLEFWFSEFPSEKIDQLEKDLIKESKPSQNIIKYGGVK
jgi:excinuclease UvrABC nuclease subunit